MRVVAAILAAGQGTRFGGDKTSALLGGKPLWQWSFDAFTQHPRVDEVLLVGSPSNVEQLRAHAKTILGGATRQESSRRALEAASDADVLLVHDAARPLVTAEVIDRVLDAVLRSGAAAPAIPVADTIKAIGESGVTTLDRRTLRAMQTPQGARTHLLRRAHLAATEDLTDEMALVEALGVTPELVEGDPANFKVTTPEDMLRARAMVGSGEVRTGFGYDVHAFSPDPNRPLMLGGVRFEEHPGLEGHSDADVLLHAATDALLGAAALGDIGQHFPNTDPRWRGEPSLTFLAHAGKVLGDAGWEILHLDASVIAESPKVMRRATEIREAIAGALGIDAARVSVKATTNERLGFIGRSEGIAAMCVATIRRL